MSGVLVALLLVMMLPVCFSDTYSRPFQLLQFAAIPIVLMLGSSLYTSYALTRYATGSMGMLALMSPASSLEKLLCSLIVNLTFLISLLLFFLVLHHQTITFGNRMIPVNGMEYTTITRDVMIYVSYCYFLLNSAVFLGSICFTGSVYVKTFACLLFMALIITVCNSMFARYLASYPLMMGAANPFSRWNVVRDASLKVYKIPFPHTASILLYITPALTTVAMWVAAYERLKEKQI